MQGIAIFFLNSDTLYNRACKVKDTTLFYLITKLRSKPILYCWSQTLDTNVRIVQMILKCIRKFGIN